MHQDLYKSIDIVSEIMALPNTLVERKYGGDSIELTDPEQGKAKVKALLESIEQIPCELNDLAMAQIKDYFQNSENLRDATISELTEKLEPLTDAAAVVSLLSYTIAKFKITVDYTWPTWRSFMDRYGKAIMHS